MTIDPNAARFSGEVLINVSLGKPSRNLVMHGQGLTIEKAIVRVGKAEIPAVYKQTDKNGSAEITVASELPAGDATIDIRYSAIYSSTLDGLYKIKDGDRSYIFSQFQTIAARKAFPCFDEPGFKTPYDIQLTLPKGSTAIANTLEVRTEIASADTKTLVFETTKPLPTYLVAFAVGDFDIVAGHTVPANDIRLKPLPLRGVATHGKGAHLKYALENTASLLSALESYFGISFPFQKLDILAVPDFAAGAMENAGAITYREDFLLLGKNASYEDLRNYGTTHAHEMSHQWFGNLVTPYWWDDIWLNESFASWAESKIAHSWRPQWQFDLDIQQAAYAAMRADARTNTRAIQQPILTEDDISNALDSISYDKGASVLAMVENYMGQAAFQQGVRLYLQKYRFGNATAESFYQSLAAGGKQPEIIASLKSFVQQAGLPQISVSWTCAATKPTMIHISQSRYAPYGVAVPPQALWTIPLNLTVFGDKKPEIVSTLLSAAAADIPAPGTTCPTAILPDAGGHGYYHWSVSPAIWTALVERLHDLPVADALSVASNFDAAFMAGSIDTSTYLKLVPLIALYPSHIVSAQPMARLAWLTEHARNAASREKLLGFVDHLYAPISANLGLEPTTLQDRINPVETELMRTAVINFLATEAGDATLRARLAKRGRAYVGYHSDATLHPELISPALAQVALAVAAQDGDLAFIKYLINRLARERDTVMRNHIINALATISSADAFELIRPLVAGSILQNGEVSQLVFARSADKSTRQSAWAWFKQDHEAIIKRTPDDLLGAFPFLASGFCSTADKTDVAQFFSSDMLARLRGATRSLAQTLEDIEQCVALKQKQILPSDASLASR